MCLSARLQALYFIICMLDNVVFIFADDFQNYKLFFFFLLVLGVILYVLKRWWFIIFIFYFHFLWWGSMNKTLIVLYWLPKYRNQIWEVRAAGQMAVFFTDYSLRKSDLLIDCNSIVNNLYFHGLWKMMQRSEKAAVAGLWWVSWNNLLASFFLINIVLSS